MLRNLIHIFQRWYILIIGCCLVAGVLAVWQVYSRLYNSTKIQDARVYPVHGIDVSHHQQTIDWQKLQSAALMFAYIKATEGATYQDAAFVSNWHAAQANHILPGAYHFFTFCRNGMDQANNYLMQIKQVKQQFPSLPPAVDIELQGNCTLDLTAEQLRGELKSFLQQVQQATGCQPVIYTTEDFYNRYLTNEFTQYPLWIRSLHQPPNLQFIPHWTLWQYTHRSKINGINTLVDQNVFNGTAKQFSAFRCIG